MAATFAIDCQRALTQKRTLWSRFEYRAAYDNDCRFVLPLRPSAIAAPPSGPSSFQLSLLDQKVFAFLSAGADKKASTLELVRAQCGLLERLQR